MKPTPVINFIAWVYLLLGMENFFWAAFRFIYEAIHGQWTRFGLNITLAVAFIIFSMRLSRAKNRKPGEDFDHRHSPVKAAWGLSLFCFALQYYRFALWSKVHVNTLGISQVIDQYLVIINMHDTWIAMMASLVLAQEFRQRADLNKNIPFIVHWELLAGNFRARNWFKKSIYLELTEKILKIRSSLLWLRRIPLENIIEVKDVPLPFYPPVGLAVHFRDGKRERQLNFISTDYRAWITAFEGLNIKVNDASGLREKQFHIYRWWRFYTVARAFIRCFIGLTILLTLFCGILGSVLYKDYDDLEKRFSNGLIPRDARVYNELTRGYAKSLNLWLVRDEGDHITLRVEPRLLRLEPALPAYFNHLFRENKIVLYKSMNYSDIRFRANSKLKESSLTADAGFLYAFPFIKDKNGSYRYKFVYLVKIEMNQVYLTSIEVTYHKKSGHVYWNNVMSYKVTGDFELTP